MLRTKKYIAVALFLFVLMLASTATGQSNYGAVRGTITDAVGATLSNATVTLTSETTKIVRTTVANGSGEYAFSAVDPGKYKVSASMAGFKLAENTGVIVDSGNTIPLDLKLQIGATTEIIEVNAAERLVDNG